MTVALPHLPRNENLRDLRDLKSDNRLLIIRTGWLCDFIHCCLLVQLSFFVILTNLYVMVSQWIRSFNNSKRGEKYKKGLVDVQLMAAHLSLQDHKCRAWS